MTGGVLSVEDRQGGRLEQFVWLRPPRRALAGRSGPRGGSSDASPLINPKVILACARGTTTFYRVFYRVSWYGR